VKVYKKIILALLLLLTVNNAMAQNMNKPADQRVIYEQKMSYDDALQMKSIVEKMEKEKDSEEVGNDEMISLMGDMNNDSGKNLEIVDMLKTLLKTMGINGLPGNLDEQTELVEDSESDKRGEGDFKSWGDSHDWQGIRTEQR